MSEDDSPTQLPKPPAQSVLEMAPVSTDYSAEYTLTQTVDAVSDNEPNGFGPAWAERMVIALFFFDLFVFLVSLRLDMDLPGTLWNCFIPLFVGQGIFAMFAVIYMMAIKVTFVRSAYQKAATHWNQRSPWYNSIQVNVPPDLTIWQFVVEAVIIMALYTFECVMIPKIQDVVSYSWSVVFIPAYVAIAVLLLYYAAVYTAVPCVARAEHYRQHYLGRHDAAGRGVATLLVLLFAMLMNLYLEGEYPPPLWTAFIPLFITGVMAMYWMYRYFSLGNLREVTMFEVAVVLVTAGMTIVGTVFFFLKLDGTLDWTWFAVLSPVMLVMIIMIALLFAGISLTNAVIHKRRRQHIQTHSNVQIYPEENDDMMDL